MFDFGKPFQPSLMFVGMALPTKGTTLRSTLALPANIRQGWEVLPWANTQAYYKLKQAMAIKSFITLGQGLFISSSI